VLFLTLLLLVLGEHLSRPYEFLRVTVEVDRSCVCPVQYNPPGNPASYRTLRYPLETYLNPS